MSKHTTLVRIIVSLLVMSFCLALSGCASSEARPTDEATEEATLWLPRELNQELERLNYDLDYTTAYYDYSNSLYDDNTVEAFHNLSNTQLDSNQQESLAVGGKFSPQKKTLPPLSRPSRRLRPPAQRSFAGSAPMRILLLTSLSACPERRKMWSIPTSSSRKMPCF